MDIEQARINMIEQQIRPWDVLDVDVLKVLEETPREKFVPNQYTKLAFSDLEIPLKHSQFMMAPKVEARMLQALQITSNDNVLEIGTGSGFITACLANLSNYVETIEYYSDLSSSAQSILEQHAINNVKFINGDALQDIDFNQKFDVIAVTASMPTYNNIFDKLLADKGRMFVVVGKAPVMQARLITRVNSDGLSYSNLFETYLGPMVGIKEPQVFQL